MPDLVRFGPFELDLETAELQAAGRIVRLPEQQFQILQMLLLREGGVVSREEIRKTLWPNDTVVEFDRSINAAIMKLRISLGDTADKPGFIETLARRGYRLMVAAERAKSEPSDSPVRTFSGSSLIGRKVSHYRVLGILGGGGMGLVYKGEDLKLNRPVAMKFLPEELSADPVTLQRFEREARTASSLNHPNICTIFEVEEFEGQPFIVMELLEGESLREVIARSIASSVERQGGLPLGRFLDIASQIAEGLNAAHQKGIIHRDIKPANIFVSPAGKVKVLDFGLAKLADLAPGTPNISGPFESPVRIQGESQTDLNLSQTGITLGTAGYMSPEQVRGEKLDARTDLFSFGLILYEMATGKRAVTGETAEEVQNAILNQTLPPVRTLNPKLPAALEKIISKALEKDRDKRYTMAAEILEGLADIAVPKESRTKLNSTATIEKPQSLKNRAMFKWVGSGLVAALLVAAGYFVVAPRRKVPFEHFTIQQAIDSEQVEMTAISPDSAYLASVMHDAKGFESLTVHHIATTSETRILHDPAFTYWDVIYSPDGNYIYFRVRALDVPVDTRDDEYRIPVLGGQPERVIQDIDLPIAFTAGGQRLCFYRQNEKTNTYKFLSVRADGGDERVLANGNEPLPKTGACSPDGKRAAIDNGNSIEVLDFATGQTKKLISMPAFVGWKDLTWDPSGNGIFARIWTRSRFATQIAYISYPDGKLHEVTNDLNYYGGISLSADGKTLASIVQNSNGKAEMLSLSDPAQTYTHGPGGLVIFSWLDNDRIIASDMESALRVVDLRTDKTTTLNVAKDHWFIQPSACGGERIVAAGGNVDGSEAGIFNVRLDGSAATQLTHGFQQYFPECAPDGSWLYYMDYSNVNKPAIMRVPLKNRVAAGESQRFADGFWYSLSPDGKLLAITVRKLQQMQIYSTESGKMVQAIALLPNPHPRNGFSADSKSVFYLTADEESMTVWRQSLDKGDPVKVIRVAGREIDRLRISPDGKELGLITIAEESRAVLLRENR